ncbi:MAG: hemin uptake protein HemP [Candidatus Omnitrophica bacterium]|nr:hemin uptake protein HemP [Candidatus Omnitrophota bacterium]
MRLIDSKNIFEGNREVLIQHERDVYRLIITKSGKLVLNK